MSKIKEILKGQIYEAKYDECLEKLIKTKIYHIMYDKETKTIYIDAPFPVRQLRKLRKYLDYKLIYYKNIIIGRPDI